MATALTVPTGTQIINLFAFESGAVVAIGSITADAIDNHVTNEGEASVPNVLYNYVSTLLTNAGLNPAALDDVTEYPYAWKALRWLCVYELLRIDFEQRACQARDGDKVLSRQNYMQKMESALQFGTGALAYLGITDTKYHPNLWANDFVDFDTVDRCFDWTFNPNN
ncbi:MAG: hypothetical protein GWN62_16900 [Aliifodinibius sp.]|nr:hypothetical protein [Fodinibius sp.]